MNAQATTNVLDVRSQQIMEAGVKAAEQLLQSFFAPKHPLSFDYASTRDRGDLVTSTPPMKKRCTVRQKSVRFATEKRVHVLELKGDYDFPSRRWYQEDDYKRIKQENLDTLIAISHANGKVTTMDATEFCIRGLEQQINTLLLQMPLNRQKKVVQSVLCLQQVQRNMQAQDEKAIREMSRIISKHDKLKAWKIATMDAYRS